jgi:hypothetical protein
VLPVHGALSPRHSGKTRPQRFHSSNRKCSSRRRSWFFTIEGLWEKTPQVASNYRSPSKRRSTVSEESRSVRQWTTRRGPADQVRLPVVVGAIPARRLSMGSSFADRAGRPLEYRLPGAPGVELLRSAAPGGAGNATADGTGGWEEHPAHAGSIPRSVTNVCRPLVADALTGSRRCGLGSVIRSE